MARSFMSSVAFAALLAAMATSAFAAKSPKDFIQDAIQGDDAETMLGQIATQKSSNPRVQQYGQTLVADHSAQQQADDVAKSLGVTPPDHPMAEAQDEQTKLSKLSGAAFDKDFLDDMVKDHEKTIKEFQDQAKANQGPTSDLATKQLPVLQKHLQMAQEILANSNQTAAATPAATDNVSPTKETANVSPTKETANVSPTRETAEEWRASKLAGVPSLWPRQQEGQDITDVLMNKEGKAELIVIGVGGFLEIGEKDVSVPYDQVKFTDRRAGRMSPLPAPRQRPGTRWPPPMRRSPPRPTRPWLLTGIAPRPIRTMARST